MSLEMKASSLCEMRQKFEVQETQVQAAFKAIEKIELAANNGDTLGEEVISVKRNKFRLGQKRKIQLKNNNQKIVQTSSFTIFFSDVLEDVNQSQS